MPVSVLILTKNEQQDLPGCLKSVAWSDDVHVYDSMSTDATVQIARDFGASVTQRPFDNWSSHQNWGLRNIAFKHPWVFYIDADERMTDKLINDVLNAVKNHESNVAFRVQRRDHLMGRWLKYVIPTPFNIRLFMPTHIRYERATNPITLVDGNVGEIYSHFNHFPFSKGMAHWIAKHNSYSTMEAQQIVKNRTSGVQWSMKSAFFEKDGNKRRFHQKELFYRLPARPIAKFFILYFVKRGFLDGYPGFTYAVLQSIYEYMIVLKTRELDTSV